jgi:Arc/MetJ-type ribon-helix-helix transcriptional regulator|tara:strand:+ start:555 stop:731 length:177 start_codon:yes stop_codon:yes gene_type:complete
MKSWATKWKTVQLPEEHYKQVLTYIKTGSGGYASVSEYVRNAVRAQLRKDMGVENDNK